MPAGAGTGHGAWPPLGLYAQRMTVTARRITVLDGFEQRHDPLLITEPLQGNAIDDGYTWRGRITAIGGDDVLVRIKDSGLSSGCTILMEEPDGRYAATLLQPDDGRFLVLGAGPVPFAAHP
jgi:hypothetical protein